MIKQFEVLFVFNEEYLKALKKVNGCSAKIFGNRVYELMNFLRIYLKEEILCSVRDLYEEYTNNSGEYLNYKEDIEFWYYPEKIYDINSDQCGPLFINSNVNVVVAKFNIYFIKINPIVFDLCKNYNLIKIIHISIENLFKKSSYNEDILANDLFKLDIEELESIKSVFKFIILEKS